MTKIGVLLSLVNPYIVGIDCRQLSTLDCLLLTDLLPTLEITIKPKMSN